MSQQKSDKKYTCKYPNKSKCENEYSHPINLNFEISDNSTITSILNVESNFINHFYTKLNYYYSFIKM